MNMDPKVCRSCGKPLKGRTDKKFCDDYCRNTHNNQLNSDTSYYIRNVNSILRKNRRILEELLQTDEETVKLNKQKLHDKGFNFKYFTNIYTNKKEATYFFCYEYGYLLLENDWCLLVRQRQETASTK